MKIGTNYYMRYKHCASCNRYKEVHIGKSSAGWQFMFHSTLDIKNYQDWMTFLSKDDVRIYDEYGKEVSLDSFKRFVKKKQNKGFKNHAKECPVGDSYVDKEGYSMSPYEFS